MDFDMHEEAALKRVRLADKGGSYHRTWKTAFRTWWKLRRSGVRYGKGIIVKKNVDVHLSNGAELVIGDYCFIDSYVYLMLSLPKPRVELGGFVGLGRDTIIAAKGDIKIGAFTQIGSFLNCVGRS